MLVVAPVVVGVIGVLVERTIIRLLYGRMIDTMLATWGLSLFLVGLTTAIFGNTTVGLSAPLGSFEIGAYRASAYTLFVIAVAVVVLGGVLAVAAIHPLRPHRPRHDAERQHGGGARRQSEPRLRRHLRRSARRCRVSPEACWRRSRASSRPSASPMSPNPSSPSSAAAPRSSPAPRPLRRCSARSIRSRPTPRRRCSAKSLCSPRRSC